MLDYVGRHTDKHISNLVAKALHVDLGRMVRKLKREIVCRVWLFV